MSQLIDIERRRRELEANLHRLYGLKKDYENRNRIHFFKPFPHQEQAFNLIRAGKKVVLLQGGNRIGKTVFGAVVVGSACLGIQPWDGQETVFGNQPIKCRIICVDWEHHAKGVVVPVLKEWLPADSYTTTKNNVGVEAFWEFKNGSTIELMTHSQETKIHEGWKGHLIWSDEPLPKDKYAVNRRGLVDYSGIFLMTMTAVYEPWILDEIALSNEPHIGCVTEVPMNANPLLKEEDIQNYAKDVPDDQRDARILGGWFQLSGKVLKKFKPDVHVVDDFKVPTDWPVIVCIDIHISTPQAVGFYGYDPYNRLFVADEFFENYSPEEVAHEIVRRKQTNALRMKNAFIDPLSKGDSAFVKNRLGKVEDSFTIIARILSKHGIRLESASKDKDSGILNLNNKLEGPNKLPALFFQRKCKRHLWEIQRWVYDKDGKPLKENDHMMENLYRATLSGVKYTPPSKYTSELQYDFSGVV